MLFAYIVFFWLALWLGICVEAVVDRITIFPPPSLFFAPPTILSLTQVTVSGRLKLVSVPFSSLVRLRVVPHFSSGIVQRAKRERAWKSTHATKGETRLFAFSRVGWFNFHARSRFARSTIPEEKWGTTRRLQFSYISIGHLEKSFPESIWCKALRWDKVIKRFAESASSKIVLYSLFIWLNGSITLIRAETERYDIVHFSKVTTKSLASGIGS